MIDRAKLVFYVKNDLRSGFIYDGYRPKSELIKEIEGLRPRAHVLIVSGAWCKDCRREVPKFTRIVERLPQWTIELRGDDPVTREQYGVRAIPTFIIQDPESGKELGRIVESPESDSLESDLLAIAERHPTRIVA